MNSHIHTLDDPHYSDANVNINNLTLAAQKVKIRKRSNKKVSKLVKLGKSITDLLKI